MGHENFTTVSHTIDDDDDGGGGGFGTLCVMHEETCPRNDPRVDKTTDILKHSYVVPERKVDSKLILPVVFVDNNILVGYG